MAGTKAKKAAKAAHRDLGDLIAKAQRRGDKLRRTLARIVAQTELDPTHPARVILRTLERSLGKLRDHGETHDRPNGGKTAKKAAATKAGKAPATPKSSAAPKTPRTARSTLRSKKDVPVVDLKTEEA